jgi:alanyl-tRNA synthetase
MGGIGDGDAGREGGAKYSVELCGGTHARRTGDIGLFKIVGEGAVSSGVRRIEALAGAAAESYVRHQADLLAEAAATLKTRPEDLPARLATLVEGQRRIERELSDARKALALAGSGGTASARDDVREIEGMKLVGRVLNGVPAKDLKGMADELMKKHSPDAVMLVGVADGKAANVATFSPTVVGKGFDAREVVKAGVSVLGGKGGGGRPDMAQGGGPDVGKADEALKAMEAALVGVR